MCAMLETLSIDIFTSTQNQYYKITKHFRSRGCGATTHLTLNIFNFSFHACLKIAIVFARIYQIYKHIFFITQCL